MNCIMASNMATSKQEAYFIDLTQQHIEHPTLLQALQDSLSGEKPYFQQEVDLLNSAVAGVNDLVMRNITNRSRVDRELKAINALPHLFSKNSDWNGQLQGIFTCEDLEEMSIWALNLPDAFKTINSETVRGHYKDPDKIEGGHRSKLRLYLFDGLARAITTRYMGTLDVNLKGLS